VRLLDRPEMLLPVLEDLGRRHVGYAVLDEHYEPVGAALLSMLKETLGPSFTPAAQEAWTTLYGFVAETMKRAAKESRPANHPGSGRAPAHL
jgi:hemoglobin-like flavoprotein